MKSLQKKIYFVFVLLASVNQYAQHHSRMTVALNPVNKTLNVEQEIIFWNQSDDTLTTIVLNDWNNAYSNKNTPLGKRFSDEFYRGFHLATEEERGSTTNLNILDENRLAVTWNRTKKDPDFIVIQLKNKLVPNQKLKLHLSYLSKIPSDKFTKYGYTATGAMNPKNWFLTPARYEHHDFIRYNNNNLDDIANAVSDFDIELKIPKNSVVTSDLNSMVSNSNDFFSNYTLSGTNRTDFNLFIEPQISFLSYKTTSTELLSNLKESKINTIQKAIIINGVVDYVHTLIGEYPHEKIIISQTDYERNPFYGLNQLPAFLSPFSDEFIFEIKFLKTYLNAYLKNSLRLDPRKDSWIYDGIQVYAMMQYIDKNYPNTKMFGSVAKLRLLKSYNLISLDFNEQYSYFYMLMARKNLDQPLSDPKNKLIKFNEQIASKYRAGLSLRYLNDYIGDDYISSSIRLFYDTNKEKQVSGKDFEDLLIANTDKDISWFFKTIIGSREVIDFKFSKVSKTKDSVVFSLKNKTGVFVPIPVYGIKKGQIVFKKWLDTAVTDSTFTFERKEADKIVLNYKNEVPEYNLRNNWRSLRGFYPNNRPLKFAFLKDLEDPYYNQILYVPSISYNLYDGLSPGLRLHNKTILDKPFLFDINPSYSTKTNNLSGSGFAVVNQNYRNSNLYNARYSISGAYFHYTPDAAYLKINPMVQLRMRPENLRDNRKELIQFRQVMVNREKSAFVTDNSTANYSVFDAKYVNTKTEITNHFTFISDLQLSEKFGKVATELEYRKLFENNFQINLRLYAGSFLYNRTNSDFFSFALDRPTDYLFDYNYYGRSENSGFFSQQFILAEGGFKSKLATPYANQWITTINGGFNIWNWLEVYGDVGLIKNRNHKKQFLYDSGIRLNLVTDYFELYFPVYSNNGWEITQNNYNEKIRFVVTFSPKTLINLFNRKWF